MIHVNRAGLVAELIRINNGRDRRADSRVTMARKEARMTIPTTITFRGLDASPVLEADIGKRVARLERFSRDIMSCRVVVESAERRHHQGNRFNVHVHLALRGAEIDVGQTPTPDARHEDAYVAVGEAFDAARRRLEDHMRKRRGDVKTPRPTRS